jgi:hypothetical protein
MSALLGFNLPSRAYFLCFGSLYNYMTKIENYWLSLHKKNKLHKHWQDLADVYARGVKAASRHYSVNVKRITKEDWLEHIKNDPDPTI